MSEIVRLVYNDDDFLCHYQVKGAKHGVRRWQYPDGSLTPEGRIHYGIGPARDSNNKALEARVAKNIESYNDRKVWRDAAVANIHTDSEASRSKRKLFESKAKYDERIDLANRRLKLSRLDLTEQTLALDKKKREMLDDAANYSMLGEEVDEYIANWATTADAKELEEQGGFYKDLVDKYLETDAFTLDELTRTKKALTATKQAMANAKVPSNQDDFYKQIANAMSSKNGGGLDNIPELKSIDVAPLSDLYKKTFENGYSLSDRSALSDAAQRIAKRIVPDEAARNHYPDPYAGNSNTQVVVMDYLTEKAYARALKDVGDSKHLELACDSFVYYDPADDYNELQRNLSRKDPEKS